MPITPNANNIGVPLGILYPSLNIMSSWSLTLAAYGAKVDNLKDSSTAFYNGIILFTYSKGRLSKSGTSKRLSYTFYCSYGYLAKK